MEKFQLNVSQYVCYIIWESHCNKIIVARLLKLVVLYIHIDKSVWHPNTEPKFFRTRFVKRYQNLSTVNLFQINNVSSQPPKNIKNQRFSEVLEWSDEGKSTWNELIWSSVSGNAQTMIRFLVVIFLILSKHVVELKKWFIWLRTLLFLPAQKKDLENSLQQFFATLSNH